MGPNMQLKREREMRGWSQARIAQEIGTSAKIVSRWECGTSLPSPYFREKLCRLFEKDARELGLLHDDEQAVPPNTPSPPRSPSADDARSGTLPLSILPQPDDAHLRSAVTLTLPPLNDETLLSSSLPIPSIAPPVPTSPPPPAIGPSTYPTRFTYLMLPTLPAPRWKPGLPMLLLIGICLLGLGMLLAIGIYQGSHAFSQKNNSLTQQQIAFQQELQQEAVAYRQSGIGISYGNYAFDTYDGRTDVFWKQQAALALQQGQTSRAVNVLTHAISADPTDGEAQIYNENLHILQIGAPFISLVLGLPIDSNSTDLGIARSDMQAAFLAQHEVNSRGLLPGGLKLRILIDNCGANNDNVALVSQFIKARVEAGNPDNIIAVVGWPTSQQSINARDIISSVSLPLVSQTASGTLLSGSSPYFFRINPSNEEQGAALGTVAVNTFHARKILVLRDPSDPYSSSLADVVSRRIAELKSVAINDIRYEFIGGTTTVEQYEAIVKDTLSQHIDLIVLAGVDVDAIRLAHAVGNLARTSRNTALAQMPILGGDAFDTTLLLGRGIGPDAELAQRFPEDMQHLHFVSFAHPDEWTFLHIPEEQQPLFFREWEQTYQSSPIPTNSAPPPEFDAILTYDAVQVIVHAAQLTQTPLTGQTIHDALTRLGKGKVAAYQGVSGRIAFDNEGDPVDKAIVVLDVIGSGGVNMIVLRQVLGTFH